MSNPNYANKMFIFILGMHRSGTSLLAGSLERCGLYMGDVDRSPRTEYWGSYEQSKVFRLNEAILRLNGGAWYYPPPTKIEISSVQQKTIESIKQQLSIESPCGLKDPRLLFLLEPWLHNIPNFQLAGTFRHPIATAHSLTKRNFLNEQQGISLWFRYNMELVRHHKRWKFPLIEYSLDSLEAYVKAILIITNHLGLKPNEDKVRDFVIPQLEHHSGRDYAVPRQCKALYEYLRNHRITF